MAPLHVHNMGKQRSDHFANLIIGDQCYLGPELFIDLREKIVIEKEVTISMRVSLITHMDVGQSPLGINHFPSKSLPIVIRQGAYVGAGSTVLMGVELGECSAIGAGCVVTKDVPAWSVMVGATGRVIKQLEPI